MNFQLVSPIVTSSAFIATVVALFTLWALASALSLYLGTARFAATLNKAERLVADAGDRAEFAAHYEKVNTALQAMPALRGRWREFADSLVLPTKPGRPIRSTTRPREWFDLGLLASRHVGVNIRYHAALPNLLVGAGLLFTFLGLAVALSNASDIVQGDVTKRNDALKLLLDAASLKFVTSLVGLLYSLGYTYFQKQRLRKVDSALEDFLGAVEQRIPLLTSVALQQDANALAERGLAHSESLASDLSLALQQAVDQAFDQRLGEHIGPLREAMEALADRISGGNEDAIKTMLDAFLTKLQGGAGEHMQEVAASLERLGGGLVGLQSGLGEAAARMSQSAEDMSRRMGEGADTALARITAEVGGVAGVLRAVAEDTRGAGASAGRELAAQLEAAAGRFEASSREVSEALARAAEGLEKRMGAQAQASADRLGLQFESMVGQLQTLAEASRETGGEALRALAEKIGESGAGLETVTRRLAEALEGAAGRTGDALGRGAEQAVERIAAATESMRGDLGHVLAGFRAAADTVGETIEQAGARGAGEVNRLLGEAGASVGTTLATAAAALRDAGAQAGSSLAKGGAEASVSLAKAGGDFGEDARKLTAQIGALDKAGADAAGRLADLGRALRDAAQPLATVSTELAATADKLSQAASPLTGAALGLGRAADQISGATQHYGDASAAGRGLADAMRAASERFFGLDDHLAKVFDELQKGLGGFKQEVSRFVSETDGQLAKAVSHLHGLVNELSETIADLHPTPAE